MNKKAAWGTAGIGKLGTALLTQWNRVPLSTGIYHPDKEKAGDAADKFSADVLNKEELGELDYLVLALPADQIIPFVKELKGAGIPMEKPVLINMATKMPTEKLRETFPELKWTYMKFVGHAAGLKRDGNGLFVTHTGTEEAIRHRFAQIGRVETAAEETAEKVNRLATTHAVQAARNMEKQMEEEGWESIYTEEALHSLMPEVIRAYSEGKLGQFGKKIVEEMDSGKTE